MHRSKLNNHRLYVTSAALRVVILIAIACVCTVAQQTARLEKGTCPVATPAGVPVECYKLTVPENRFKPSTRLISLPVIVVKSTAAEPLSDPVVYTAGGPGAGSLGMVRGAANLAPYTAKRDFIIFEQRGTEKADPNLNCPEVTSAIREYFGRGFTLKKEIAAEVAAAKTCRNRLSASGIDLGAYSSRESSADLDDLRRLLGVETWNLYGISYSTRLMVNYARDFPIRVRSIILDSVLPATANWDETGVENIRAAIGRVFKECGETAACTAKYPNLEKKFYETISALDRTPVVMDVTLDGKPRTVKLYGRHFVDLIYNLAEGNGSLQWIPFTVDAVSIKNFDPLKKYADEQFESSGFIWGMRFSVWCGEEMPFENRSAIASSFRSNRRLGGFAVQRAMPQICKVWNVPPAKNIENASVKIAAPVLAFGGEFDPDTPTSWTEMVAGWSGHGYFFKVPSTTHGAMNRRCTFIDIPVAFLANPTTMPDSACLRTIDPIAFK